MDRGGLGGLVWRPFGVGPMKPMMFLGRVKIRPPAGGLGATTEPARDSTQLASEEFGSSVLEVRTSRLERPWSGFRGGGATSGGFMGNEAKLLVRDFINLTLISGGQLNWRLELNLEASCKPPSPQAVQFRNSNII